MDGRWMVHLPWATVVAGLMLVLSVQGFIMQPHAVERARVSAVDAVQQAAARDIRFIQTQVLANRLGEVRDFVSINAALPGIEMVTLVGPDGLVVASNHLSQEGRAADSLNDEGLRAALAAGIEEGIRVERNPGSDLVDVVSRIEFQTDGGGIRDLAYGLLYQRINLKPAVRPVLDTSHFFMVGAAVLVLALTVPLQGFVFFFVNRRLRQLARDAKAFSEGERKGLFKDALHDDIGQISAMLREASQSLAEREESSHRLALAIESANAGIWDWRMDGDTVHTSEQFHRMFGDVPEAGPFTAEALLGRIHAEDASRIRDIIRGLHTPGNDAYDVEFRMRGRTDAAYRWIRSTGRVVERSAEGRAARMLGQHVDVTSQKALQARESDLARIVDESLNEVYIFSDDDFRFQHVNQAACNNSGYSREALLSMTPMDMDPTITRDSLEESLVPLREGKSQGRRVESLFRRKDGTCYDAEVHVQRHRYREAPAFVAIVLDISRRKDQERALQASEARFRMLVDQAADAVFLLDRHGIFLDVNEEACRSTGFGRSELLSKPVLNLIPRLTQDRLEQFISTLEPGKPRSIESRHRRKDGGEFPVELRIAAYDVDGVRRVIALARDISERRAAEERIRLRDIRMRKFFEGVAHAISVMDRDGRFIMINGVGAQNLGFPAGEIVGRSLRDFFPEGAEIYLDRIGQTLETGVTGEWEEPILVRGEEHWYSTVMLPMENDSGDADWVMITSYDITRRKHSEDTARAQDARYRTLVETTSAILWEADPETLQFTFVNQEAEAVLGFPVAQWLEEPGFWQHHLHPLDRDRIFAERSAASARREAHTLEYRMVRPDGSLVWLRDMVSMLVDSDSAARLVGVMIDITREKREEERFQAAFESIPIGNIVVDQHAIVQLANPAAHSMFGYAPGEMIGHALAEFVPAIGSLETPVPLDGPESLREFTGARQDNGSFPLRLGIGEMQREGASAYVCSIIDLSHVKSLEAQLAQAQRMEAVGQLAGGVAHDFNNLLHVINGFTEIARTSLPPDAPVQHELEQIALAGERAAGLTSQLLAFSRRQVMRPDNIDLNAVIVRTTSMLSRVIGEHIKLEVLASPRLAMVYADQGMIEQVLMNLCVNARDAMPSGGTLSIETENVVINETYSKDHLWANPGRFVLITITDTGCGMDRETMDRIFEPFYTTKAVHEGTGLGLSMVYGIVKQHGGMIGVYSEVGKGTTFKVYIPQSERYAEDVGTKIEGEVPTGTETILVVEDDEAVRRLSRAILEDAGYTVLEAENGRKAVHCYKEMHNIIDLVLLDVVMPDLGGRAALDEMQKIAPGVRALFASGYSENAIHTNFVLDKGLALLKKPYSRSDLLRAIRTQLDQRDAL